MTFVDAIRLRLARFKSEPPPPRKDRTTMDELRERELEAERQRDAELEGLQADRAKLDPREGVRKLKERINSQAMQARELKKELVG